MAHPHRKEASEGHNAKLRRMTEHYGSASGPANNIANPETRAGGKEEGPEPAIGFGAGPKRRADRSSRGQSVANPVATMKRGGTPKRAHGGRMKGKKHGGTHVNVLVAPQGGGGAPMARPVAAVPPMLPGAPPPGAVMPPRPPMPPGAPMGAGPMPGGPPMAPGAPGGLPPGIIPPRAKGGRVRHRDTGGSATDPSGNTGGSATMSRAAMVDKAMRQAPEPGKMENRKRGGPVHGDEKEDKELIHKILKNEGLERSDKPVKARAHGGHIKHHMDAGAASGEGRLEKIGKEAKDAGRPQVV